MVCYVRCDNYTFNVNSYNRNYDSHVIIGGSSTQILPRESRDSTEIVQKSSKKRKTIAWTIENLSSWTPKN